MGMAIKRVDVVLANSGIIYDLFRICQGIDSQNFAIFW